jgi:hypothetical protein
MRRAGKSIRASLEDVITGSSDTWWPATGDADPSERMITHALAQALALRGYRSYFEVPARGQQRLDLVCIDWKRRNAILVEAKLGYQGASQARAIQGDIRKFRGLPPRLLPRGFSKCHVVAFSTWRDGLPVWWKHGGSFPLRRADQCRAWSKARELARLAGASFGVAPAASYRNHAKQQTERQSLCFAVW